jgi:hypothetical protein
VVEERGVEVGRGGSAVPLHAARRKTSITGTKIVHIALSRIFFVNITRLAFFSYVTEYGFRSCFIALDKK